MRILVIGPDHDHGSLPPYLEVLTRELRQLGATVERIGSPGLPYDADRQAFWPVDRILAEAQRIADQAEPDRHDIVSLHFGNLEVEQLVPACWGRRRRAPVVHHVHSLDWTLFKEHVPAPRWRAAVRRGVQQADGLVFFGAYGAAALGNLFGRRVPGRVCLLPTTIPDGVAAPPRRDAGVPDADIPRATLYGFASPWKDAAALRSAAAMMTVPLHVALAGPLWDDPAQAGIDLRREAGGPVRHGLADLSVIPRYLDAPARLRFVRDSDFAVFPYRAHPTFQGSGAIADYLAHGVPVVATDVANMAEVAGDAGLIVPPGDPRALAAAMDRLAGHAGLRRRLGDAAHRRAPEFRPSAHAAACLRFYGEVAGDRCHGAAGRERSTATAHFGRPPR